VGVGGLYLGIPELMSAAIRDETGLPESSGSAACAGTGVGALAASTAFSAEPGAAAGAWSTVAGGGAGGFWAAAGAAAAMTARSIFEARFNMTSCGET
jgi:hypothetical protein